MQRAFLSLFFSFLLLGVCHGEISQAGPVPQSASQPDPWPSYRPLLQGDTLEKQREIFFQAYKLFAAKDYPGALFFFTRALEVYSQLEDYSLYYLGLLLAQQGRPPEALTYFQQLIDSYPESVWRPEAAVEAGRIFAAEGNWQKALHYGRLARSASSGSSAVMTEATLLMAHARRAQGKVTLAYPLYQEVRKQEPVSTPGKEAKAWVYDLRSTYPALLGLATEEDFLAEGRLLLKEKDEAGLAKIVTRYTKKFPAGRLRPEILRLLAYGHKQAGEIAKALTLLEEITTRYPRSPAVLKALYTWATILWNQDKDREALKLFARLAQQYPNHRLAADSLYAIGRIYQEEGNNALVTEAYTELAARFPQSSLAREGKWRQGWMAYRRGDFRRAQTLFARLARQVAGTTSGKAALYWQARSTEHAGDKDKATQLYRQLLQKHPNSYYALWAEKRLKAPLTPLALNHTDPAPAASPASFTSAANPHFLRSQELKALGLLPLARRELMAFANATFAQTIPRGSSFLHLLLREYTSVEGYTDALRLAQKRGRTGSSVWQEYLYPRAYWKTVAMLAAEKGLDPYLILALMRQESLFDPEAISPAGALGLMQLLPTTAAKLTSDPLLLTNPNVNLDLGITYLHSLLPPYNGNLILALAAYNAGEKAVERWQKRYPGLELDEFVESLSFRETRNYVKLVLRNYRTYLRFYGKSRSVPLIWTATDINPCHTCVSKYPGNGSR